jgi:hypothetical protein
VSRRRYQEARESVYGVLLFEHPGLRIGLEFMACLTVFAAFNLISPWSGLGLPHDYHRFASWSAACLLLAAADHFLIYRPLALYQQAMVHELKGEYEEALRLIEAIGPSSASVFRLPLRMYHLFRTRVFLHGGFYTKAQDELHSAAKSGISPSQVAALQTEMLSSQGLFKAADESLTLMQQFAGQSAAMVFEHAWILFQGPGEWRSKKDAFVSCLGLPDERHCSGMSVAALARGYAAICQLWTGEAEAGLAQLERLLPLFDMHCRHHGEARPFLARLYLERAYYRATHREPEGAVSDLGKASGMCGYPQHRQRTHEVTEELHRRYRSTLAVTDA